MDHAEWMDRYDTGRRTIDLRHATADADSTVDSGRDMTFTAYCLLVMIVLVALAGGAQGMRVNACLLHGCLPPQPARSRARAYIPPTPLSKIFWRFYDGRTVSKDYRRRISPG